MLSVESEFSGLLRYRLSQSSGLLRYWLSYNIIQIYYVIG